MAGQGAAGWREPFCSSGVREALWLVTGVNEQVTLMSTSSQCRVTSAHPQHGSSGRDISLQPSGVLCDFRAGTGG